MSPAVMRRERTLAKVEGRTHNMEATFSARYRTRRLRAERASQDMQLDMLERGEQVRASWYDLHRRRSFE